MNFPRMKVHFFSNYARQRRIIDQSQEHVEPERLPEAV